MISLFRKKRKYCTQFRFESLYGGTGELSLEDARAEAKRYTGMGYTATIHDTWKDKRGAWHIEYPPIETFQPTKDSGGSNE